MLCRSLVLSLMLAAAIAACPAPSQAQLVMEHDGETGVRGFHGANPLGGGVKRSFQSDAEAKAEFDRILSAVGLNWISDRIILRATAETTNAEAGISKKGERFIFYNATFMQKLKEKTTEQWSLLSVLAHELGHHLAFHTELTGNDHKYELEADYFSGFVLRRMGASLDQSHAAMREVSPVKATTTHPALADRLQVITVGWTDAGQQGAPRGLKERAPDQPSPPAAAAPPPAAVPAMDAITAQESGVGGAPPSMDAVPAITNGGSPVTNGSTAATNGKGSGPAVAMRGPPAANSAPSAPSSCAGGVLTTVSNEKRCLKPGDTFKDCNVCPEMVVIPAGEFLMGSPESEEGRAKSEGPRRNVSILKTFAVGKFEISLGEYESFIGATGGISDGGGCAVWTAYGHRFESDRTYRAPSYSQGASHPVVCVSWPAASTYGNWLSSKTGGKYRLLSEAEWEYAARAGGTGRFFFGGDEAELCKFGNGADRTSAFLWGNHLCSDGAGVQSQVAGRYRPNEFGIHDTLGNVWEWVQDCTHPDYKKAPTDGTAWISGDCEQRVIRGGSWDSDANALRSAARGGHPLTPKDNIGFRIARDLVP